MILKFDTNSSSLNIHDKYIYGLLTIPGGRGALIRRHGERVSSGRIVRGGGHRIHVKRVPQRRPGLWVGEHTVPVLAVVVMGLVRGADGVSGMSHPHSLLLELHEGRFSGHFLVQSMTIYISHINHNSSCFSITIRNSSKLSPISADAKIKVY